VASLKLKRKIKLKSPFLLPHTGYAF